MEPAAIGKAESLLRFAGHCGCHPSGFDLILTQQEACDLLEWYALDFEGQNAAFDTDLDVARRTKDPWSVLANFTVLGLTIVKSTLVLN